MSEARPPCGPDDDVPPGAADQRAADRWPAPALDRRPRWGSGAQLSIALGTPALQSTTVSIENYTGDTVTAKYVGLPANQPHTYGNFVAIWQDSVIPWGAPPREYDSF